MALCGRCVCVRVHAGGGCELPLLSRGRRQRRLVPPPGMWACNHEHAGTSGSSLGDVAAEDLGLAVAAGGGQVAEELAPGRPPQLPGPAPWPAELPPLCSTATPQSAAAAPAQPPAPAQRSARTLIQSPCTIRRLRRLTWPHVSNERHDRPTSQPAATRPVGRRTQAGGACVRGRAHWLPGASARSARPSSGPGAAGERSREAPHRHPPAQPPHP